MATGERWWYIIICCLALDDASKIETFVAVLREHSQVSELLVGGDFNTDLAQPEGARIY